MEYNFAKQQIKRINRNWILTSILAGVIIAVLLAVYAPGIQYVFGDRTEISSVDDLEKAYISEDYYISATPESFFDTGYTLMEDNKDVKGYYAFWTEDGLILCRTSLHMESEYTDYTLKGKIEEMDSVDRDVRAEIVDILVEQYEVDEDEVYSKIPSYVIDTTRIEIIDKALTVSGYVALILLVLHIIVRLLRLGAYESNKHFKKLGDGDTDQAERINQKIGTEYADPLYKRKGVRITRSWVVISSVFGFKVYEKNELIWLYHKVTRHRYYGIIPVGRTYAVVLGMKDGKTYEIAAATKAGTMKVLEELEALCPRAICGYSEELEAMYKTAIERFISLKEDNV